MSLLLSLFKGISSTNTTTNGTPGGQKNPVVVIGAIVCVILVILLQSLEVFSISDENMEMFFYIVILLAGPASVGVIKAFSNPKRIKDKNEKSERKSNK